MKRLLCLTMSIILLSSAISVLPSDDIVEIEAESGNLTEDMRIYSNDAFAFGGAYIAARTELDKINDPLDISEPSASYDFDVSADGQYFFWIRLLSPSSDSDSSYMAIDGQPYSQIYRRPSPDWGWVRALSVSLEEGDHTLKLKYRDAGQQIDKIVIASSASFVPSNTQEKAMTTQPSVVSDTAAQYLSAKFESMDIPEIPEQSAGYIFEAENGEIKEPMTIVRDETASGGAYIVAPDGHKKLEDPYFDPDIHARYKFYVSKPDNYAFWFRLHSPKDLSSPSDSTWVGVNEGHYNNMFLATLPTWSWKKGMSVELQEGYHTLNVKYRNSGQKLDKIIIVPGNYKPTGMGALPGEKAELTPEELARIKVKVNDREQEFNFPPQDVNGTIFMPVQGIFTALGGTVSWRNDRTVAVIQKGTTSIEVRQDSQTAFVDGAVVKTEKPTQMINGVLMTPLSFVLKATNATVTRDERENWLLFDIEKEGVPSIIEDMITFDPSYRACTFTVNYNSPEAEVSVFYRRKNALAWTECHPPEYNEELAAFRGSMAILGEGSSYEVKVIIKDEAQVGIEFGGEFTTPDPYEAGPETFFPVADELLLIPTFENIGYYLDYPVAGAECTVSYREAGDGEWKRAYAPFYDTEIGQFRGSIVGLKENTAYEVQASVSATGQKSKSSSAQATTWNSNPPIGREIPLSEIYDGESPLVIQDMHGSADGFIKIVGNRTEINVDENWQEAVYVANSDYIIFDGIKVSGGNIHGFNINNNSSNIRIQNCEITNWGRAGIFSTDKFEYQDYDGSRINNDAAVSLCDVRDIVVERTYAHDPKGHSNAWSGPDWQNAHPAGPNAIHLRATGVVIRYNDFIGSDAHRWNDAIEGYHNGNRYGGIAADCDIYGNVLAFGQDDGIEMDGGQMNARFYQNRIEYFLCGISTAPNMAGPSYIFENLICNLGDEFDNTGNIIKHGGGTSFSKGMTYMFNNTFYAKANGVRGVGIGTDADRTRYMGTTRNNIIVTTKEGNNIVSIEEQYPMDINSFDYDLLGNEVRDGGLPLLKIPDTAQKNGIKGLPGFVDLKHGVYQLAKGSLGIDAGTVLDNFRDTFEGSAPDIGAFEHGVETAFLPYRPIDVSSDKYQINLTGSREDSFTLQAGTLNGQGSYEIRINEAEEWLSITNSLGETKGELSDNSRIVFTAKADPAKITSDAYRTIFTIRFENGYSVPITVIASK